MSVKERSFEKDSQEWSFEEDSQAVRRTGLYLENRILATQIFSNENREKTSKVRKEGGTVTLGGEAGERKATKRHS